MASNSSPIRYISLYVLVGKLFAGRGSPRNIRPNRISVWRRPIVSGSSGKYPTLIV